MKLRDFALLTDENIDPELVAHLRQVGFDVLDVVKSNLQGSVDVDLMRLAAAQGRVIVTHDADFGTLAIHQKEPLIGIVYLRPGHIEAQFTIETMSALFTTDPDITPPFVIVTKRTGTSVTIRVRQLDGA